MKKITRLAITLLICYFFFGCAQKKPEDIKMSELKKVCDYVEAMKIVTDVGVKVRGEKEWGELSDEERKYMGELREMARSIEKSSKRYKLSELEECPHFESVVNNMNVLDSGDYVDEETIEKVDENIEQ